MIPAPPRTIPAELAGEQPQARQERGRHHQADQTITPTEHDADKQSHHLQEVFNKNNEPRRPTDAAE